jgi:hypothetical protein
MILFGILFASLFAFYLSVWTQYHSGGVLTFGIHEINLGKINAVDDGIPAISIIAIFTGFSGV